MDTATPPLTPAPARDPDRPPLPEGTEKHPARLIGLGGDAANDTTAALVLKRWSPHDRRQRARRQTLKLAGVIFVCALPGTVIHILLALILPGILASFVFVPSVYYRLLKEEATVFEVEGVCPRCRKSAILQPYMGSELKPEMTVLCPECGQTSKAIPAEKA